MKKFSQLQKKTSPSSTDRILLFDGENGSSILVSDLITGQGQGGGSSLKYVKDSEGTGYTGAVVEGLVDRNKATGNYAHAEGGNQSTAGNINEYKPTTASGVASHAEGEATVASAEASHAEGEGTIAASNAQHVSGKYNIEDRSNTYAEIIGNGSSSTRSNARTLDWSGNEWLAGSLTLGQTTLTEALLKSILAGAVISKEAILELLGFEEIEIKKINTDGTQTIIHTLGYIENSTISGPRIGSAVIGEATIEN